MDLVRLLGTLVTTDGTILIPGIKEMVAPVTEDEKKIYTGISYTMDNLYESLGSKTSVYDAKEATLMARWRFPSLSIHGVEGAFSAPGAKTVIPAKVIGKFSIRTVPDMKSGEVDAAVFAHLDAEFAKLIGLGGRRVERPGEVGAAWDEALAAGKPFVLDIVTDPNVPPIPPHITFAQAKNYMGAVIKDPEKGGMIRETARSMLAKLLPGRD